MITLKNRLENKKRRFLFERFLVKRRLSGEKVFYPLYSKQEIEQEPSRALASVIPFLIKKHAPTVIVCPGGAYEFLSFNAEGGDYAKAFNKAGFNVFLLNYRVAGAARFPNPMEDLARAICFIKAHAAAFCVNEEKLVIVGSSAGGHLCAYFGARYREFETLYQQKEYSLRPSAIVLSYPVISMCEETHELSRARLLGLHSTREEQEDKSVELIADENYPPTFFWHCEGDRTVPISNSIRFDERLTKLGVKHVFMRYPDGGHGIGLGRNTTADGWFERAVDFLKDTI